MTDEKASNSDKSGKSDENDNLDYVLSDVGEFGKHQIMHFFLMVLPIVLASTYAVEFIVMSSTDDYRCKVPECDKSIGGFSEPWLRYAVPFKNNRPEKCVRYNYNNTRAIDTSSGSEQCLASIFNQSDVIKCNDFIFKTDEHRIMKEFGIFCDENEYKLALVGTINNIGGFLFMPLTGLLSDKFGRLSVLICGMFLNAICGLIKAFASSYTLYMTFEFLGAAAGISTYITAFVLCVEWVSSKHRIASSTVVAVIYPIGEILVGVLAMTLDHYRPFLLAIYAPALLIVFYFWLVPESVRWLVVTGQYDRALEILNNTAKHNNRQISDRSLEILKSHCQQTELNGECENHDDCSSYLSIFSHKILIVRLITCSLCWIVVAHLFYGLSVNSTKIAEDENKYVSFITTMMAEIPASISTFFILKYVGRRNALCGAMFVAGAATIASTFVPSHYTVLIRIIFFTAMCATSSAFAILYIFSAEIWPTAMRNTLMNICSMIGRLGSMLAPLTTLLGQFLPSLPLFIFGGTAILSGFIVFLLPETRNKKLPDTIDEAKKL